MRHTVMLQDDTATSCANGVEAMMMMLAIQPSRTISTIRWAARSTYLL